MIRIRGLAAAVLILAAARASADEIGAPWAGDPAVIETVADIMARQATADATGGPGAGYTDGPLGGHDEFENLALGLMDQDPDAIDAASLPAGAAAGIGP